MCRWMKLPSRAKSYNQNRTRNAINNEATQSCSESVLIRSNSFRLMDFHPKLPMKMILPNPYSLFVNLLRQRLTEYQYPLIGSQSSMECSYFIPPLSLLMDIVKNDEQRKGDFLTHINISLAEPDVQILIEGNVGWSAMPCDSSK